MIPTPRAPVNPLAAVWPDGKVAPRPRAPPPPGGGASPPPPEPPHRLEGPAQGLAPLPSRRDGTLDEGRARRIPASSGSSESPSRDVSGWGAENPSSLWNGKKLPPLSKAGQQGGHNRGSGSEIRTPDPLGGGPGRRSWPGSSPAWACRRPSRAGSGRWPPRGDGQDAVFHPTYTPRAAALWPLRRPVGPRISPDPPGIRPNRQRRCQSSTCSGA